MSNGKNSRDQAQTMKKVNIVDHKFNNENWLLGKCLMVMLLPQDIVHLLGLTTCKTVSCTCQ